MVEIDSYLVYGVGPFEPEDVEKALAAFADDRDEDLDDRCDALLLASGIRDFQTFVFSVERLSDGDVDTFLYLVPTCVPLLTDDQSYSPQEMIRWLQAAPASEEFVPALRALGLDLLPASVSIATDFRV